MTRIAICDDESWIRERLQQFLLEYAKETGRDFEILMFSSANLLLQSYPSGLDLLLLDIAMNGLDGMQAANEIRKTDDNVCIIFITTMANRAIEGYRVHAYGFIKKPVNREELWFQLDGALAHIDAKKALNSYCTIQMNKGSVRLPVNDISYVEVQDHRLFVHIGSETRSYWISMNELEEHLVRYGFFRPHASYLVNYRYISHVSGSDLMLINGISIPISQHRKKRFLEQISAYMRDMG